MTKESNRDRQKSSVQDVNKHERRNSHKERDWAKWFLSERDGRVVTSRWV